MAHSQTAHRLAKPQAKTGSRVTTTEFPSVPERRAGPEPHAPRGRIHALQGPFEPIGVRGESKAPADRATPSVRQPSSHPPALQRKPLTTRQASLPERPADDGKASGPRVLAAPPTRQYPRSNQPDPGKALIFRVIVVLSINWPALLVAVAPHPGTSRTSTHRPTTTRGAPGRDNTPDIRRIFLPLSSKSAQLTFPQVYAQMTPRPRIDKSPTPHPGK